MRSDGDGFESVWDYPRPPRLELTRHRLAVRFADRTIADTWAGYRALETSHGPTYHFPPSDVAVELLRKEKGRSLCELKGNAEYMPIIMGDYRTAPRAAWAYTASPQAYAAITGYLAFYPSRVDSCFVGTQRVVAQKRDWYRGWITSSIRGPFKGSPGSANW